MAMNELQSELLRLLSKGKNKQDVIIEQIDKLILDSGLKQITKWRNSSNEKKNPLLHELVERELINVVSHVVEKYAFDVNLKRETDGITAFQVAFEKGDSKMCDLLKKIGATEILVEDVSSWEKDKEKEKEQLMNIVWLDLEMTCFENPEILECAVIITDKDLNPLAQQNWVIHFEQNVLDGLAEWHQKTFADKNGGGNGLFADVLKSTFTNDEVEEQLLDLLKRHCQEGKCSLAGSSIHIDKEVLKLRMPKVHAYLHYRIIDVSSFQAIIRRWAPWIEQDIKKRLATKGQETVNHRAMDDIEWSISFMREFRPVLTKQHGNADPRKNEAFGNNHRNDPPAHHRHNDQPAHHHRNDQPINNRPKGPPAYGRQHSQGSSSIVRNLPDNRNNWGADNRPQLYADEKRLLERIEHEKNFSVKSLKLPKRDQEIYDANPHLREVFIKNQPLIIYEKEFTTRNRFLKLSSARYESNNSGLAKLSTTEHWGQRKLFLTEMEFLTNYAANDKYLVVYAGAAPGSHIIFLSQLFPQLEFVLIDTNDFSIMGTNEIRMLPEKFTDSVAKRFCNIDRRILFICNVRTFNPSGNPDNELMSDMLDQMEWHKLMKPRASLLNFRLPRTAGKTQYLKGDLVIEPWASKRSTECRLIVDGGDKETEYDHYEFDNTLLHFHNEKRIRYYKHNMDGIDTEGLDHCYDCAAEIFIIQEYLCKVRKVKNEAELKNQTDKMSRDISRKIVDRNRDSCIDRPRTLDVIPKKR